MDNSVIVIIILLIAILIYITQLRAITQAQVQAQTQPLTQAQTQAQTQVPIRQPIDCVGAWRDVGYCNIDRCDPSNNTVGLGKQRQEFVVQTYSQYEGKPCPGPTREVDCSLNKYIDCAQCGGLYGSRVIGATCDNINTCDRLMGIGERIDKWSVSSYAVLPNCIMPQDSKVTCRSAGEWTDCKCSYDISSNSYCNENNTVCEGDSSVCTVNFTKKNELPGGVCPPVNNTYKKTYDQKCSCDITRVYDPWIFTMEKCGGTNNQTSIGTRKRTITITKKGGNKVCKIRPETNEQLLENTTGIVNKEGYFQFKPEVDIVGGTFQTIQIEKDFNKMDDNSCICEGNWSEWKDVTTCPNRKDYTKLDSEFKKIQRRDISSNKLMYPNMTCPFEERTLACPRDCSGSFVTGTCKNMYGLPIDCLSNTSGLEQGTITNTFNVFKSQIKGEDGIPGVACPETKIIGCDSKCDINCVGAWRDVGTCTIDRCDPTKNTIGLGKQKQEFVASITSKNQGNPCPGPTRVVDCSLNNYIECTQCGGSNGARVIGATCDNIKTCDGKTGIGERIDKWSVSSYNALPYCVMPQDSKVTCRTAGDWSNCMCSYDISSNSFCNETNTVCQGTGSECTVNYTKREPLPQPNNAPGICTEPVPKHYNVNLDKCGCTVTRTYGDWIYTNPRCDPSNRTTLIDTSRSRPITITKTGGNKACVFQKISNNETILDPVANNVKGKINPNGSLQFGATNDFNGATLHTVETENNISFADNINCCLLYTSPSPRDS